MRKNQTQVIDSIVGPTIQTSSALTRKVNKLKHLRDQLKQLKAVETSLVGDIKDYLGNAEILLGTHGEELVTYKPYTSYRLDTNQLKDEYPEVYTECSYEVEARKFLVK